MQKTGTIVSVIPTQKGGYQGREGWIYTFTMTINCPDGQFTGEIGSKTQMYPLGQGQPITVDVNQTEHGVRFKKVNPQYAGQQGQPPQQPTTHLNAATQAIIDKHREPSAGEQIQDRMLPQGPSGPEPPNTSRPTAQQAAFPPMLEPVPTPQEYAAKEREKVLGMCFTNLLAGRLAAVCPTEMEKDLGAIAALWRLSAVCIDGTGQIEGPNI